MKEIILIRPYQENDFDGVLRVYNTFAKDSFAAYCNEGFDVEVFRTHTEKAKINLVLTDNNRV